LSKILSSTILDTWKMDTPSDLAQLKLVWSCADGAHGEREYLVSCDEKKYQVYSGFVQSKIEILEKGYFGWMDNYAGQPPDKKYFSELNSASPIILTKYVLSQLCGNEYL